MDLLFFSWCLLGADGVWSRVSLGSSCNYLSCNPFPPLCSFASAPGLCLSPYLLVDLHTLELLHKLRGLIGLCLPRAMGPIVLGALACFFARQLAHCTQNYQTRAEIDLAESIAEPQVPAKSPLGHSL